MSKSQFILFGIGRGGHLEMLQLELAGAHITHYLLGRHGHDRRSADKLLRLIPVCFVVCNIRAQCSCRASVYDGDRYVRHAQRTNERIEQLFLHTQFYQCQADSPNHTKPPRQNKVSRRMTFAYQNVQTFGDNWWFERNEKLHVVSVP